ncbi:hypothetical protein N2152v2_005117 [Parachlorella kessleri]
MRASTKVLLCLFLGLLLAAPRVIRALETGEEAEVTLEEDTYGEDEDGEGQGEPGEADDKDVVVLTEKNFDDLVAKTKYALVMFYAPWCGHCKTLKPEYAKAATQLKASVPDVTLAKVDATEEKELGSKFEVQGYPTLKWFVDGKPAGEYSGGRTVDTIIQWIKKKTGPATKEVSSVDDLESLKTEGKLTVLGFFEKLEGDDLSAYESFAQQHDEAVFLTTTSAEVAKAWGIEKAPGFALGRNYEDHEFETVVSEGNKAFEGDGGLGERLGAFLKAEKLPAYLEFKQANQGDIFQSGITKQVIVGAPGKLLEKGSELVAALKEVSKAFRGELVFVISKVESDDAKPVLNFFGLDAEKQEPQVVGFELSRVVGFELSSNKKYVFSEDERGSVGVEALKKFAAGVIDGTAKKFFKSAPAPEVPTEGGVTVVVGNTVESIVKDPTKDVLLEVYAPWCGHCKQLTPIYEKLAKRFSKVDSVVIAKMDGTENEHPDIQAQGYPTLLFFPAEEGADPIPFEGGGRTLAELTKFIKTHAKIPFELPKKKKAGAAAAKKEEEQHEEL